jgi:hypothetical protein
LYFARLSWSTWSVGSSVGYGRYSVTSFAQRSAFGTPAAVRAAAISAWLAVFAAILPTAAELDDAGELPPATGEEPVARADEDGDADPLEQAATMTNATSADRAALSGVRVEFEGMEVPFEGMLGTDARTSRRPRETDAGF